MAEAERSIGWLAACEEAGRYLAVTNELVSALAAAMMDRDMDPVLEVCAGDGTLAEVLWDRGFTVTATDAEPPAKASVERMAAAEALGRDRPRSVIGCFVPVGSGADRAVLETPSVERYLVLNARLNGQLGDPALWRQSGWEASRLRSVEMWMLTRHDVWLGRDRPPLQHGEAWLLERSC